MCGVLLCAQVGFVSPFTIEFSMNAFMKLTSDTAESVDPGGHRPAEKPPSH